MSPNVDKHTFELFSRLLHGTTRRVDKPWGREYVVTTQDFLLKVIEVDAGHATSLQHHEVKREIHWLLAGDGTLELREAEDSWGGPEAYEQFVRIKPTGPIFVVPGDVHRAVGPLLIMEISTNHPDDVVRHEDAYGRANAHEKVTET